MRRIDSLNRAVDLFGAGKDGFKAAIPGVTLATELTPDWFNQVQEAIVRTIEAAGLPLSQADYDQFTTAVQQLIEARVTALVNSAPATLDTLKELADALGDDPNFAATMVAQLATKESFASGTRLLFQQGAAPVGWTKVTDHDNKALRVVSGAAGSGGTLDFTSAFTATGITGGHALTIDEMPAHGGHIGVSGPTGAVEDPQSAPNISSASLGGSLPHSHSLNLDVKYVDVIIASKN